MAQPQTQVFGHGGGTQARRIASTEVAVDVALVQAGVLKRALGQVGVQTHDRQMGGQARGVLMSADDGGFSVQAHAGFPRDLLQFRSMATDLSSV